MTNPIFFGLSTIIHLLVIAWNGIQKFFMPNHTPRPSTTQWYKTTKALSALYIVSVFAFVMFCGATILYASVIEPHSSVRAIEQIVPGLAHVSAAGIAAGIAGAFPAPTTNDSHAEVLALYLSFFAILVAVFVFATTNPDSATKIIGAVQQKLSFRPLFVSVGISMFLIGTLSAFFYLTPVTTAAAYVLNTLQYVEVFTR